MTKSNSVPHGAPPEGYIGPKRSLILAGGGMRLSYQAGALRALLEEELSFSHIDSTSGGSINLAMLLSGLSPSQMCDNWRSLNPKDFVSLMPLIDYLKLNDIQAMGDAGNIIDKVFPHLGIDFEKINAVEGIEGTFNICNYTRKVNEVISHKEVNLDFLVAGMSLPAVLPPVQIGNELYHDSAFMRDANLMEAVRRGAEEIWLIWVLGNTNEYKGGFLGLYVNMLEVSANGALHQEFEQINEINERILKGDSVYGQTQPIKLHLIKPEYPLPLDPELYFDRIDNATLIDMGYADAKKYLQNRNENGVPYKPEVTKMKESNVGITFRETMEGGFYLGDSNPRTAEKKGKAEGINLSMHATINIRDCKNFIADPNHKGAITGDIDFTPFGENIPAKNGVFNLFSPADDPKLKLMVYELAFEHDGEDYYLAGKKEVKDDPGFDLWSDTTTLFTKLHKGIDATGPVVGAGILRLGVKQLAKLVTTLTVTNASSMGDTTGALADFGSFFLGELWTNYAKMAK